MTGDTCFDAPSSDLSQLHITQPFHHYLCASVSSLHRQPTLLSHKLCTYLCVRSISQPPAGLGAGCYLAGKLGFGAAVWVSGRSEKGSSISGAEPLLENRDISAWESDFILHSAWDSQRLPEREKIGSGGRKGHRKLRCSLRPLGGHRQLHSRWRSSRLSEQSVNAALTANPTSVSTASRNGGWFWLHMLCSEEKRQKFRSLTCSVHPKLR